MAMKIVSIFYIYCMLPIGLVTNELLSTQPFIHLLVTKITYAIPTQKYLLLDTLNMQLKKSQKKITRQVMITFCNTFYGIKFD